MQAFSGNSVESAMTFNWIIYRKGNIHVCTYHGTERCASQTNNFFHALFQNFHFPCLYWKFDEKRKAKREPYWPFYPNFVVFVRLRFLFVSETNMRIQYYINSYNTLVVKLSSKSVLTLNVCNNDNLIVIIIRN